MSKLQRRTVTSPVLPDGIREAMLPIDTAFRNQLLDKDNFDTYGTAISTLKITDNMTDLPSSGKRVQEDFCHSIRIGHENL